MSWTTQTWAMPHGQITSLGWPGRPENPLMVAFHGWLDNACTMQPLGQALSEFPYWAFDLPGHGHSSHPPAHSHPHWVDYMDTLHAVATQHTPSPCWWVGHSLGASIVSMYASVFPELVKGVILIDMLGPLHAPAQEAPARLRASVLSMAALATKKAPVYPDPEAALKARQAVTALPDHLLKPMVARNLIPCEQGVTWRTDPRLMFPPSIGLTEEQTYVFLQNLSCPTLVLLPEQGLLQQHPVLHERLRFLPAHAEHQKMPGGHHGHWSHPEPYGQAIRAFVRRYP